MKSLEGNTLIGECDFKNNGVGFGLYINKNILEECIEADSNEPYWANKKGHDLRNPLYENELAKVLEQMENM